MKRFVLIAAIIIPATLFGQSQFSSDEFMQFIENNKSLTVSQLLDQYPPKTTYYSTLKYPVDLKNVPWFDSLDAEYSFTDGEKELLKNNAFMVSERLSSETWVQAFGNIYFSDLPLFLSTDFILFTLHQSYDEILKTLEWKMLEPNLMELLQAMYNKMPEIYNKYKDVQGLSNSLGDVDLYLAIANSLLFNEEILPQVSGTSKYYEIMEFIENEQAVNIPFFTRDEIKRKVDFSQFIPRGHYTDIIYTSDGERTLEDYFKAMMWLGRIDFLLTAPPSNPWEPDWETRDLQRMNISALIMNEILFTCGKKKLFDIHEKVISFMVGPDDNMTPGELKELTDQHSITPEDLLDEDTFTNFRALINSSDDYGQKIMSNFFYVDPRTDDPGELPVSYKILGQKFLIDSYVFSEVVYDRIIYEGKKIHRPLPDPLDMLSAFGNENAMALMEPEMEEYKYAYKINELRYLIDSYDESFWTESLYNTWLSGLLKLNPPETATGLPYFMKTVAWHHEKLNTQLTSWAQLRHDNILYGKQSYTGGTGCSFPHTYVEPYPDFYGHLQLFAQNAAPFFEELLGDDFPQLASQISDYYSGYGEIMGKLEVIASKELSGESLQDSEIVFLKSMINEFMASGPSVSGWIMDLLFPAMGMWDWDFTVADVHTQPTDENGAWVGHVLHVGNGKINLGVILAPCGSNPSGVMAYVGPVGSFYTVVTNDFERLNDIDWEGEMLMNSNKYDPERPEWVNVYLADGDGAVQTTEQTLKGYQYTWALPVTNSISPMEYLLPYPNPAKDEIRFRLLLSDRANVTAEVIDMSGRVVNKIYSGVLPAAEHDFSMELDNTPAGLYIIRMAVNGNSFTRKFMVE